MTDTRHRNAKWNVGETPSFDGAQLAVLMDIRDELQSLNNLIGCRNAVEIPTLLRKIARNTARHRCRSCPRTFETSRGLDQHIRRSHQ